MKYFRPVFKWFPGPPIEGDHLYALPNVECPVCKDSKSGAGITYPWIDAESIFETKHFNRMRVDIKSGKTAGDRSRNSSWGEYKEDSKILREKLRFNQPLPPGVRFGIYCGKVIAPPKDLALDCPSQLFANRSVVEQLNKEGFELKMFDTQLTSKQGTRDYVELWAPPMGWSVGVTYCTECQRSDLGGTQIPVLRCESIPAEPHLFRLIDAPKFIIFSETLVNAIRKDSFTVMEFKEVSVE